MEFDNLPLDEIRNREKKEHLQILHWVKDAIAKPPMFFVLLEVPPHSFLDQLNMARDAAAREDTPAHDSHLSPFITVDETDTFPKGLSYQITRAIVYCLGVFVRVFEDHFDMLRLC
ncbi:hypothetical protein BBP40_012025 [Aspergillus hancockii]|nr:hypothetical protein BBP40_012025 [Aspergillus hancockii]